MYQEMAWEKGVSLEKAEAEGPEGVRESEMSQSTRFDLRGGNL